MVNSDEIGKFIILKRREMKLTQADLAKKLLVSPQAVSKWERGESMPDTGILVALAKALSTSTDSLLTGGRGMVISKGFVDVVKIKKGVQYMSELKTLLGENNSVYRSMVEGLNKGMNIDFEDMVSDSYKREAIIAEIMVQNIMEGYQVDLASVDHWLTHDHWKRIINKFAKDYKVTS